MKGIEKVLFIIFVSLFFLGIAVGLTGRVICIRSNEDYDVIQPELFAPDAIAEVLYDEELHQLYVCYNDASYVNVYSEQGEFLWAVSTPYLKNVYFEIREDKLYVYNSEAYVYSLSDGAFITVIENVEELDLSYNPERDAADKIVPGYFYHDTYRVYKAAENGDLITVVSRPWWYGLLNFGFCWCVSFCGALGIGVLKFLNFRRKYLAAKKYKSNDTKAVISSKKANRILKYMQITTAVQAAYTVLDIVFGIWFNGILCIGIVPITAHFIVSNIIIWNTLDFLQAPEDEISILDYWKTCETVSFIIAFLSVIVAVGFAMAGIS